MAPLLRQHPATSARTHVLLAALLALALLLAGCAAPPARPAQPASHFRVAPDDAPLSGLQAAAGAPDGRSAFQPLLTARLALQTRLAMIAQARTGIDIQTYLLGNDATGHQIVRALRDAAARGVRIRLLVDDFFTAGLTDLLLGMAAHDNVEVRLYNPFPAGRDSVLLRLAGLLGDFGRLNRRMHNKLFVADGRVAIVGGRNLADPYFMRSEESNFIDFELLCAGAVVPELESHFDHFWNSGFAVPVQALADNGLNPASRRASLEAITRRASAMAVHDEPSSPARLLPSWVVADARVYFDSPDKTAGRAGPTPFGPVLRSLEHASHEVVIVSPYFLPSAAGLQSIQAAQERGVQVRVITNSLVDSDEPLVSVAYGRHRLTMLRAGVRLFELSSQRLRRQAELRQLLGNSVGRLHAKLGFIDGHLLMVGSMNLDPRSASTNTELVLIIDSAELTQQVLASLSPDSGSGLYEVQMADDGQSLEWVARDAEGEERLHDEPAPPWWLRLRLWLLSRLVPDDLL